MVRQGIFAENHEKETTPSSVVAGGDVQGHEHQRLHVQNNDGLERARSSVVVEARWRRRWRAAGRGALIGPGMLWRAAKRRRLRVSAAGRSRASGAASGEWSEVAATPWKRRRMLVERPAVEATSSVADLGKGVIDHRAGRGLVGRADGVGDGRGNSVDEGLRREGGGRRRHGSVSRVRVSAEAVERSNLIP